MVKHLETTIWLSLPLGKYPHTSVRTLNKKEIELALFPAKGEEGTGFRITRHHAKMLARRITQCLDETKTKQSRSPHLCVLCNKTAVYLELETDLYLCEKCLHLSN